MSKLKHDVLLKHAFYALQNWFTERHYNVYLKITHNKGLDKRIKDELDDYALFAYNKREGCPDIIGFSKFRGKSLIITAEVAKKVSFTSIYQAKRYAEILRADWAFLISNKEISSEKKKILLKRPEILKYHILSTPKSFSEKIQAEATLLNGKLRLVRIGGTIFIAKLDTTRKRLLFDNKLPRPKF